MNELKFWVLLSFIPPVLLKARLNLKLEALRLQRFLPQKLGPFKEACFRRALLHFFKKLKVSCLELFYIFQKK